MKLRQFHVYVEDISHFIYIIALIRFFHKSIQFLIHLEGWNLFLFITTPRIPTAKN